MDVSTRCSLFRQQLATLIEQAEEIRGEITLEVQPTHLVALCHRLCQDPLFAFQQLIDLCGVDYLQYGISDWETTSATTTGFSRGVMADCAKTNQSMTTRFAVVYHLLSLTRNQRLRLRVKLPDHHLFIDSVTSLWPAADWYEREAFDLFGILFNGHPDLRRLLTDYGFVGYPFRKDFPLIGTVEARYDATLQRVIYEPVSIEERILEPKVIRQDPPMNTSEINTLETNLKI